MNFGLEHTKPYPRNFWLFRALLLACFVFCSSTYHSRAFSLLGPFADWMKPSVGYRLPGDIGGPMKLGEGYRWNVPVVTYAFDQSFVEYFGSNGITAVEQAIQILNDLPPASNVQLTDFPPEQSRENYRAASMSLSDLKSSALAPLLGQLGLAEPTRNIYVLLKWNPAFAPGDWGYSIYWPFPEEIECRNFDPLSCVISELRNNELLAGYVWSYGGSITNPSFAEASEVPVGALNFGDDPFRAVTDASTSRGGDFSLRDGQFFLGLTYDDAGGLRYSLNTTNAQLEMLLPNIHGVGTNANAWVNLALRPGIEKVTFVPHVIDGATGQPTSMTNQYVDTYISNSGLMHQQLARVISQPDFVFSAGDVGAGYAGRMDYAQTGTENWWNSSLATGGTNLGPGIIRPPIKITFNRFGTQVGTQDYFPFPNTGNVGITDRHWGSFEDSTNAPIVFPVAGWRPSTPLRVRFTLGADIYGSNPQATAYWVLPVTNGGTAALQLSTNLANWVSCAIVTNQGAVIQWNHTAPTRQQEYFRVIPQ